MKRKQWKFLFWLYCFFMFWLLFGQRLGHSVRNPMQLKPLETISWFLWVLSNRTDTTSRLIAWKNLLGNVVLFIPLGFFVPWLWEKSRHLLTHLCGMLLIILSVELLQYVTGLGTYDVDDVILNIVGTSLGWLLWKLLHKFAKT